MTHSEAVAKRIEGRIAELNREIEAHERALAALHALGDGADTSASASNGASRRRAAARAVAPAARSRRAPRASTSNGRSQSEPSKPRRRRRVADAEAVFEAIKSGEDQATKIARQFGVSPAVVRSRLQQLEEAGRISRTGNRRSTRWRSHSA